jgi:cysteine synthase
MQQVIRTALEVLAQATGAALAMLAQVTGFALYVARDHKVNRAKQDELRRAQPPKVGRGTSYPE